MIAPLHNWKDKLKNLIRKYPKTTTGVLVVVLSVCVFVGWTQVVSAWDPFTWLGKEAANIGKGVLAGLLSIVSMILFYVILTPIFWLIAVVIQIMVEVASWQLFINEPAVVAGWTIARDLVNVGFIAVLLYIAFGTVISYKSVDWKRDLVKLITAVVLVNFSRMIVGLLIDVSQVIMLTFLNGFRNIAGGNITGSLGLGWYLEGSSNFTSDLDKASGNFIRLAIGIAMGILLLSILAMMTAWLLLRIVKLWLLTVMAPFYFLAGFFPFLKSFESYWKKEFTDQLVAGPFMAFGIWFAMSVISQTGQASAITTPRGALADAKALTTYVNDGTVAQQSNAIFTMIIGAGLLYGVYDMSKSMAGTAGKVGMDVLKTGKAALKSGAMTVGKYADIGLARASKKVLKHDLSVGGARDYVREMTSSWNAKVEAFKAAGDAGLKKHREGLLDKNAEASPIWKSALDRRETARTEKGDLTKIMKEREKGIKESKSSLALGSQIEKRLMEEQGKGKEANLRRQNIAEAMSKAKSGDFSALKSLMADGAYSFPADLKDKVAKYEGLSGKLSQGKSAIDNLYSQSLSSGGTMGANELSALVASGFLTNEEASKLTGKNINNLAQENPMIFDKLNNFKALADDMASGAGIDPNKAAALGLKTDEFDIFTSLQAAEDKEMETFNKGKAAKTLEDNWKKGKLSVQEAKDLGLSESEQDLVTKKSLSDLASLKVVLEQKESDQKSSKEELKLLEKEIDDAEKQMKSVKRNLKENYLKSTSTRAIEGRYKKGRDALLKDMQARFPNHDTPEDLAEIVVNVKDPEAREFAIDSLQPDNVEEFVKNIGSTPDVYGVYEVALRLADKLNDKNKALLDKARSEGSNLDENDEKELMVALNDSISDPYVKETYQKFLKKSRQGIPGAKHVLEVDKITGNVEFMASKKRREKDFQALSRGEMQANKYDGFAHETPDGNIVLDDVGYNYFKNNFGRINKYTMHNYEAHYIQSLVENQKVILGKIGTSNPNYDNMKKNLAELEERTYRRLSEMEDAFEEFKIQKPSK